MTMTRATTSVQNLMAGCLSSVIIFAVLVGLATAMYKTRTTKHAAVKRPAQTSRLR